MTQLKTMEIYMSQVEIIKQINNYTNNNKFNKKKCNEYSRNIIVIKYDRVRNLSGRHELVPLTVPVHLPVQVTGYLENKYCLLQNIAFMLSNYVMWAKCIIFYGLH